MFFIKSAYATCPVCVITVGGGLILAKRLGIDDLLVSIWISGLNTAVAYLIASKIKNKIFKSGLFWSVIFYGLTIIYLWFSKQLGHPGNTFFGADKVILGMTLGFFVFLLSVCIDKYIRKVNKGKVLFYYQKVIIPLSFLLMTTIIFKVLLK